MSIFSSRKKRGRERGREKEEKKRIEHIITTVLSLSSIYYIKNKKEKKPR